MRRAKCVVDEEVPQLGECAREARIVLLLPTEEPRVLEQQQLAWLAALARLERFVRIGGLDEDHLASGQLTQSRRDGLQRVLLLRLPLGTSEVRQDYGASPTFEKQLDRWQRRADSGVVRYPAFFIEWNVQIDSNEGAIPPNLFVGQISDGFLSHGAARLEAGPHEAQHIDAARCIAPLVVVPAMHDDQR